MKFLRLKRFNLSDFDILYPFSESKKSDMESAHVVKTDSFDENSLWVYSKLLIIADGIVDRMELIDLVARRIVPAGTIGTETVFVPS